MIDAFEELKKWHRKHYSFDLSSGTCVQPGDGCSIKLTNGKRTVFVSDCDECFDHRVTLDQVILEALKRWHDDTTIKNYYVYFDVPSLSKEPFSKNKMMQFKTGSEKEAINLVLHTFPDAIIKGIYER